VRDDWNTYLEAIGTSEVVKSRVAEIERMYELAGMGGFETVFISEYVKDDGTRELESLWLFSSTALAEAKQFLHSVDLDFARYDKRVVYCRITATSYNFQEAVPESRLKIEAGLLPTLGLEMKASGRNCDFLSTLLRDRLLPETAPPTSGRSGIVAEDDAGSDVS
jgi:hypothetical protein